MDAVNNAFIGITNAMTSVFPGLTMGQIAVAAILLLLLAIVFICTTVGKSRENAELETELFEMKRALEQAESDIKRLEGDFKITQGKLEADYERLKNDKDDMIADLTAQNEVLTQFRDKYQSIPDAEKEAARIMADAKNKAFIVANRTEKEYIEIIDHANKEAESIRQLAQERLTRSHETLKNAIARANEIVDEARVDAERVAGVTYVAQPARIAAPEPEAASE